MLDFLMFRSCMDSLLLLTVCTFSHIELWIILRLHNVEKPKISIGSGSAQKRSSKRDGTALFCRLLGIHKLMQPFSIVADCLSEQNPKKGRS